MFRRLFWVVIGAGVGLWGRQRALDTIDKRVPKSVQRKVQSVAINRVKRFVQDVKDAERKKNLERELEELRARESKRKRD